MNNEELRLQIIKKTHELLDNPNSLWHRLYKLKPCMMTSLDHQVCFQNSLLTLTLKFEIQAPLNINIHYTLKDTYTKETENNVQGRVQNIDFFMECINQLMTKVMTKIIFDPQVDWELLNLSELKSVVVPKIRELKEKIRNFSDNDELARQIQIESQLYEIKTKLLQLSDPESHQYAQLVDLLET